MDILRWNQNQVAWIKADTKAILAIHEHVITNNARLSVTHNDYNTWTLNIRGVKREDRGQYMCQVNTDPMKMQVNLVSTWLYSVIFTVSITTVISDGVLGSGYTTRYYI